MAGAKYLNLSSYFRPTPSSLEVGAELNRGAYGAVHAGELDGRPAAIKKIHIRLMEAAKEDEKSWEKIIKDFEKECRLLETLEHPHIVGFWGAFYDVESKEPILVMEQMKENLRDFLAREVDLSRHRQVDICLSIARALEFLHSRSPPTVHRDLTDKNVMLSQEGVVKVGDLGQSHLKDSSVEYFNTGQPGAVPFMPPEALRPTPHYTEKIDMFSLGVLMLEVATGHQPSAGLVGIGTQPEVVRREKDLSKLPDDHPLRPIILECLKDDYKERPPAFLVRCFVESEVRCHQHEELRHQHEGLKDQFEVLSHHFEELRLTKGREIADLKQKKATQTGSVAVEQNIPRDIRYQPFFDDSHTGSENQSFRRLGRTSENNSQRRLLHEKKREDKRLEDNGELTINIVPTRKKDEALPFVDDYYGMVDDDDDFQDYYYVHSQDIPELPSWPVPVPSKRRRIWRPTLPAHTKVPRGLKGLRNLGNTCFMNCILQCLSHTPKMADIFKGSKLGYCQESVMKGQLAKAYGDLLKEMWDEGSVSVSTTGFKSQIQKYAKHFMGHDQQDCQEFLRFLLSGLHKDLNSPVSFKDKGKGPNSDDKLAEYSWRKYLSFESSPISDLFMGQLKSTLVCEKCKQRSVTFDPFWDLSPPMKRLGIGVGAVKVTDCLKEFTTKMKLEGQESAYCDKCDSLEEAEKTLEIQKLPKILVLHLNRFAGLRFRSKLDIPIDIPLQLEMGPYLVNKSGPGTSVYSLYGVANHSGTAYGGHYTALCKHVHSGQWYSFDDSQVSPCSAPSRPSTQAYVLFYSRKDQN